MLLTLMGTSSVMLHLPVELEILNGVSLYVDHIKQEAFLKDPKHIVPYKSAVEAVTNLNLQCDSIVTNTLFKYSLPKEKRLTFWQKERLLRMANQGCTAYEIASAFGVSEGSVMRVVGEIIKRIERENLIRYYKERLKELENE